MKRIVLAVTNDLSGDQRIHKVSMSLIKFGYSPLVIGRRLKDSQVLARPYFCHRFRLLVNKGPLFYLEFNFRLFLFLLFSRYDCILSNDLDTLPASFFAGRLRRKRLVYDSHEYFTEVPELVGRPFTRKIWKSIEAAIFPNLTSVYTVNGSIARIYTQMYGVQVGVVRNIPMLIKEKPILGELPAGFAGHPIILYQGAVNIGRGLEEMIRAMSFLPECRMVVVGAGDCLKQLQDLVVGLKLPDRIHFAGRLPFDRLAWYTRQATIGMSLEQNLGLSYYYSLPNKLFDYLHAGLPVIASDLPEIKKIVEDVSFGLVIDRFDPEFLSRQILFMINSPALLDQWRQNALDAASRYTWEFEEEALKSYFPIIE